MKSQCSRGKWQVAILTAGPALAAAGAMIYSHYRRDLKQARARISSGSKLANTSLGPIEYADVGTGVPVLAIHGAGGGFDQGLDIAQPLIEGGWRVIAPSRFGYLRTPLPRDASPGVQADAHAALLDALQLDRVAVVGVSAGAPSAMQLCLRHPDRCTALVLVVPLAYSARAGILLREKPSRIREFLINTALSSDFLFWALSKLASDAMFKTILGTPPADVKEGGAAERARLAEFLAHIAPISRRKEGLLNEVAIATSLYRYDLERLSVPTLVIGVENCLYKTYSGAQYTAQNIRGARLLSYPRGGHLLVGHEREVWREVDEFLRTSAEVEHGIAQVRGSSGGKRSSS